MIREEIQFVSCILVVGDPGILPRKKMKTKNAGEAISGHFAKCLKSQIYLNYAYLQLFQEKVSDLIMSWQICREVLNA